MDPRFVRASCSRIRASGRSLIPGRFIAVLVLELLGRPDMEMPFIAENNPRPAGFLSMMGIVMMRSIGMMDVKRAMVAGMSLLLVFYAIIPVIPFPADCFRISDVDTVEREMAPPFLQVSSIGRMMAGMPLPFELHRSAHMEMLLITEDDPYPVSLVLMLSMVMRAVRFMAMERDRVLMHPVRMDFHQPLVIRPVAVPFC